MTFLCSLYKYVHVHQNTNVPLIMKVWGFIFCVKTCTIIDHFSVFLEELLTFFFSIKIPQNARDNLEIKKVLNSDKDK